MPTEFDHLLADYIVALANNAMTDELAERLTQAVAGGYDRAMQVVDAILRCCRSRIEDGAMNAADAIELVRHEYLRLGFSNVASYKYLLPAIKIYLDKTAFIRCSDADKVAVVYDIYLGNANNDSATLRVAMYLYCLKLALMYRLYSTDIDLLQNLTSVVDALPLAERQSSYMPVCLMNDF